MPRKSVKKGGAFAYADQFNFPLSPCYKPKGQPEIPRAGWHAGGGGPSCDAEPSVSQMGVIDKPLCNEPTGSEQAWDNRFGPMKGGDNNESGNNNNKMKKLNESFSMQNNKQNFLMNLQKHISENTEKKPMVFSMKGEKNGVEHKITVIYSPEKEEKKFLMVVNKNNNNTSFCERNSVNSIMNKVKDYKITKLTKSRSNNVNKAVENVVEMVNNTIKNNSGNSRNNSGNNK